MQRFRPSTSQTSASISLAYGDYYTTTTTSRPRTRGGTGIPSTARPRTSASTIARLDDQTIVCAVAESRGISPIVGLAFVNLDTAEATLCQICDSQTYVRTIHKIKVHGPSEIIIASTAASPKSKLFSIIEESADDMVCKITLVDRHYWAESIGYEYIQSQAFKEDVEAIKASLAGNYYVVCCIAAVSSVISKSIELKEVSPGLEVHRVWLRNGVFIPYTQDQV
jgi:DNA mismatch repair protein MSH4